MTEPYYKTHEPPHRRPTCGCGMLRDDAAAALWPVEHRMRFGLWRQRQADGTSWKKYLRELKRDDVERLKWLATNMRRVWGRREVGG